MNFNGSFSSRNVTIFSLLLIAVVCLLCYSNTFSVPFQFDDPPNISEMPFVRDIGVFFDQLWGGPGSAFVMRIVGFFTFAVNYRIHGDAVAGYHVVNLLIHILNGFLVYFLVLLTFRTAYFVSQGSAVSSNPPLSPLKLRGDEGGLFSSRFIPLAAALLFVSHPIQTQAVTYIVQRFTSLATLFYLLSLVMYIKWRLSSVGAGLPRPYSFIYYLLSLISAVLAMKTKEIAFTLPLVISLYEFMFFSGILKKRILYLVPLLLTMLIIPLSLMGSAKPLGEIIGDVSEATRVQTDISRWEYLFTQVRVIVTYIRLLFFPVNQNLDYDYPVYLSFFDPNVILSFLFLMSIFGIGVYLLYKSRQKAGGEGQEGKNRGREGVSPVAFHLLPIACYRLISFGIFWFFITLSIESSVIPITDVIFEHRLYLPSIGFFIAVTGVFSMVRQRKKGKTEWASKAVAGGLIAAVVLLSGVTYARNTVWRSEVSLWEDVVKKSPSKLRVHSNLGRAYNKHGRLEEAEREYQTALRIDPNDYQLHNNLGVVYKGQGRLKDAIREYQNALRLKPDDALGYYNLGNIFREQGDFEEAIQQYQTAIRLEPDIAIIHNNLGIAFIGQGNKEAAAREFRVALDIDPGCEAARRNLEMLLSGER
ncbi:MAG: tetratricopeptide repeat protein [Nitrospiraceae bacterium]|nr:MAG: tetratricopeptide repeat protein [Nitrospiraceae bacterium]